jgi:2-hydroxycyclohexanecarboxyl-CoA dehydrogenase
MSRYAVVTGAGNGIGKSIATVLHKAGWRVVACDIDGDAAADTAAELDGESAVFDLSDPDATAAAAQDILDRVGGVSALVNNAGWDVVSPFADTSYELRRRVIDINLHGPMTLTNHLLPSLLENAGRIVNISSDAGRTGSKGEVVYSASKAGILGFTRGLAREVARDKVTVNAVCPGPTDTPLYRKNASDNPKLLGRMEQAIPLGRAHGRIGKGEDVAHMVAFLLSEEAEWITGQTISVNGGLVIG